MGALLLLSASHSRWFTPGKGSLARIYILILIFDRRRSRDGGCGRRAGQFIPAHGPGVLRGRYTRSEPRRWRPAVRWPIGGIHSHTLNLLRAARAGAALSRRAGWCRPGPTALVPAVVRSAAASALPGSASAPARRLCHSHSRGGRPASRRQSPASLWPRVSLRSARMRHEADSSRVAPPGAAGCARRHAKR